MKKLTSTPAAIAQLVKEYPAKNPSEIAKMAKGLGYTAVSTSIVKTVMAKNASRQIIQGRLANTVIAEPLYNEVHS
jgi:hypothetical protein